MVLTVPGVRAARAPSSCRRSNEGVILYMPTAPPGMSENESARRAAGDGRQLKQFPEVASVFGKIGRAETATDPAPLGMVEVTVVLKPRAQWRKGMTWDGLIARDGREAAFPRHAEHLVDADPDAHRDAGDRRAQPARHRGASATTSRRSSTRRSRSRSAVSRMPGTRSAFAERSTGGFYIDFERRRAKPPRATG